MQSTPSEPSIDTTIIRTGSDGRLRYTAGQRQELLEAFDPSGLSAMAFSRQHGVSYQTFIAWLRKRGRSGESLPPGVPAFAEVMLQEPPPAPSAALPLAAELPQTLRRPC